MGSSPTTFFAMKLTHPLDLIGHGVEIEGHPGRQTLVIPSISFSAKCAESLAEWDERTLGPKFPP